ncbi:hypothetical protein, partial [Erythrobacter sp.]|uniref:hypothetical protein n=1 Tax=Erythrobacter sp. TaxID=1042 RepID=UPI00311FC3F6
SNPSGTPFALQITFHALTAKHILWEPEVQRRHAFHINSKSSHFRPSSMHLFVTGKNRQAWA